MDAIATKPSLTRVLLPISYRRVNPNLNIDINVACHYCADASEMISLALRSAETRPQPH